MDKVRLYRHDIFLHAGGVEDVPDVTCGALTDVARWLDQFVSRPHPAVGRTGDVCPWTRRAGELGGIQLTYCLGREPRAIDGLLLQLKSELTAGSLGFYEGSAFRSIVVVFPERGTGVEQTVVAAHRRLKPAFLAQRLMLGEFFPSCEKPGLHNPAFRPLCAPWPLLVIRPMVEADLEFLLDSDAFIAAYLRAFGRRGARRLAQVLRDRAEALEADRAERLWQMVCAREVEP